MNALGTYKGFSKKSGRHSLKEEWRLGLKGKPQWRENWTNNPGGDYVNVILCYFVAEVGRLEIGGESNLAGLAADLLRRPLTSLSEIRTWILALF